MSESYLAAFSDHGYVAFNAIATDGEGMEAQAGVTGLGLPPIEPTFSTTAGDGAEFLGRRIGSRSIDVPITVVKSNRTQLRDALREMATTLTAENLNLVWVEAGDVDTYYTLRATLVGGGDYVYGTDTQGDTWARTTLTFQSEDVYWKSQESESGVVTLFGGEQRRVATIFNEGSAPTPPVWKINGPVTSGAITIGDKTIHISQPVTLGSSLTIDTENGTVVDEDGFNRYASLGPLPQFAPLKPGTNTVTFAQGPLAQNIVVKNLHPNPLGVFPTRPANGEASGWIVATTEGGINPPFAEGTLRDKTWPLTVAGKQIMRFWPKYRYFQQSSMLQDAFDGCSIYATGLTAGKSYELVLDYTKAQTWAEFLWNPWTAGKAMSARLIAWDTFNQAKDIARFDLPLDGDFGRKTVRATFVATGPKMYISFLSDGWHYDVGESIGFDTYPIDVYGVAVTEGANQFGVFNGSTVSDVFTATWDGAVNASTSTATIVKETGVDPTLEYSFNSREWLVI